MKKFSRFFLFGFFICFSSVAMNLEHMQEREKALQLEFNRVSNTFGVRSLKEIVGTYYIETFVIPACKILCGETIDGISAKIKKKFSIFPKELCEFVKQQLFYSCFRHGWNVNCRKTKSNEVQQVHCPYSVNSLKIDGNVLTVQKICEKDGEVQINFEATVDRVRRSPSGQFVVVGLHDKSIVILKNDNGAWNQIKETKNGYDRDCGIFNHHIEFLDEHTCISGYDDTITLLDCTSENRPANKKFPASIKAFFPINENHFLITTFQGHMYACKKIGELWTFDPIGITLFEEEKVCLSKDRQSCALVNQDGVIRVLSDRNGVWDCVKKIENPNANQEGRINDIPEIYFEDGIVMIKKLLTSIRGSSVYISKYIREYYDLVTGKIICKDDGDDSSDLELKPSLEQIIAYIALSNHNNDYNNI